MSAEFAQRVLKVNAHVYVNIKKQTNNRCRHVLLHSVARSFLLRSRFESGEILCEQTVNVQSAFSYA